MIVVSEVGEVNKYDWISILKGLLLNIAGATLLIILNWIVEFLFSKLPELIPATYEYRTIVLVYLVPIATTVINYLRKKMTETRYVK